MAQKHDFIGEFLLSNHSPLVSVIVVNYNCRNVIVQCIASLMRQSYPNIEIILVDNASSDGSVELTEKLFPIVKSILSDVNLGYAGGCNLGIDASEGQFILLLNPDCEAESHCVEDLVKVFSLDENTAIVGGAVRKKTARASYFVGSRFLPSAHFPLMTYDLAYKGQSPIFVDIVSGACLMIKRQFLSSLGKLDERFFLYYEDAEFCARAIRKGRRIILTPRSVVSHTEGFATDKLGARKEYISKQSNFIFFIRTLPLPLAFFACTISSFIGSLGSKHPKERFQALLDILKKVSQLRQY